MRAFAPLSVLVLVVGLASPDVGAQVFSPGALSKAHASIDDVGSCTACHDGASQQTDGLCLACHKEVAVRMKQSRGLHARTSDRRCAECHSEHRGRGASLIELDPKTFDHRATGFPLLGSHVKNDCRTCHRAGLIDDADAKALLATRPKTFLGLPSVCSSCHFDEHRGQLGMTCEKCHTPGTFKPALGFDHADDSVFALVGQHNKVDCVKCHVRVADPSKHEDAEIAPRKPDYAQLVNVPHESCASCHTDPHEGRFGVACSSCHQANGWRTITKKSAVDFAFHDTTKFPLRGEHRSLSCKSCHGPFRGEAARFRGTRQSCADCHVNAHRGQIDDARARECATCHTPAGFTPVTFGTAAHDATSFPLRGAHKAVACSACHANDAKTRAPADERAQAKRKGRPVRLASVRLQVRGASCAQCHADPHRGAFNDDKQDCSACHQETTFAQARFDHSTSFPLTGKHASIGCATCHARSSGKPVRYAGAPTACTGCHDDVHGGQFETAKRRDCTACHNTSAFVPSTFRHGDPALSSFPLEDAHAKPPCVACHLDVAVAGRTIRRYRPTPSTCVECHSDPHDGRYRKFAP